MKKLFLAAVSMIALAGSANALIVDTSNNGTPVTRSATVSNTATFFKVDPKRPSIVEVIGSGSGTLKVTTDYSSVPTTFTGFVPDPNGAVSTNTGWHFDAGLSYVGFDASSGTWTVRVAQP